MGPQRILFLTCHLPYPPFSGGRRREFELIRRISRDHEIHLCAVSKVYSDDVQHVAGLRPYCAEVDLFPVDESPAEVPGGLDQIRRHASQPLTRRVAEIVAAGDADVIHVEGFYMMQHVPSDAPQPILLVEQNVEYLLWKQRTGVAASRHERRKNLANYLTTLDAETQAWRRATICAVLTEEDREAIVSAAPDVELRVVPDGVDHMCTLDPDAPGGETAPVFSPSAVFAANFAYQPNVDAAVYLCDKILPLIRHRVPDLTLWLVGNAPPPEVAALGGRGGVVVTGRVPSVEPYLAAADVVLCPLRIGGGIKVKVLEALFRGKALVTTEIGAQGLDPSFFGRSMIVENEPRRFALAAARLLRDPRLRRRIEDQAPLAVASLPTWDEAAGELISCYRELLSRPSSETARAERALTRRRA